MKGEWFLSGRKLEIAVNILAEGLNYLLFASLAHVLLTDFTKQGSDCVLLVLGGLFPVLCYLLRERCRKLFWFLALHGAAVVLAVLLVPGELTQRILFGIGASFFAILSLTRRLSGGKAGMDAMMPPVAAGIFAGLHFLDARQGQGLLASLLLWLFCIYMAGYLFYYYLKRFEWYVDVNNRTTEKIPMGNLFFSTASLAGMFILIAFFTAALGLSEEFAEKVQKLLSGLLVMLGTFLYGLLPEEHGGITLSGGQEQAVDFEEMFGPAKEPSILARLLDILIGVFAVAVLAFLCFRLIMRVIAGIREGFARRQQGRDQKEMDFWDQVETLKEDNKRKPKRKILHQAREFFSPEEQIRKSCRRLIEKAELGEDAHDLIKGETIREKLTRLFPEKEKEGKELASLYEKARYAADRCSHQEAKRARELSQQLAP